MESFFQVRKKLLNLLFFPDILSLIVWNYIVIEKASVNRMTCESNFNCIIRHVILLPIYFLAGVSSSRPALLVQNSGATSFISIPASRQYQGVALTVSGVTGRQSACVSRKSRLMSATAGQRFRYSAHSKWW